MFEVIPVAQEKDGDVRRASFQTCGVVCSLQIDIELEGDTIRSVRYTGLERINCKGRGTSCPDQLARALKMME